MNLTGWKALFAAICLGTALLANAATPVAPPASSADQARQDVERTVRSFYQALHDHDLVTIERLIPSQGFTEFSSRGGLLKQQTLDTVRTVFAAGAQVDVQLDKLRVDLPTPDVALVTGLRIGVVSLGSAPAAPQTRRMTSVWVQQSGGWKLAHVHYSALD